jgi:lathosterol oxidase
MSGSDDSRPVLDRWLERAFGDEESGRLGSGWLSGTASVFLGGLGLLAVLVLWFPAWLTTPRFRALYPLPAVRALIQVVIATAFVTGCLSMLLRRRKVLGLTGAALALLAALLGGGGVALPAAVDSRPSLGLDWFVLNLFLLALLFVPLERFFPGFPSRVPSASAGRPTPCTSS